MSADLRRVARPLLWASDMLTPDARALIISHLDLVRRLARYLRHRYVLDVPREELESFGMMGLVEAAQRFEPDRGHPFASYARPRIRGAILDGLGQLGSACRATGRAPMATGDDHDRPGPDQELSRRRLQWALRVALDNLPQRWRRVVEQRYFEHRTLVDIGVELGVSRSRASRLHAAAIRKLRVELATVMSIGDETLDAELSQVA